MRKGFLLIEMISVIALLAILSLGVSRLYTPVISDNPYTMRLFSTNDTLIAILKQIRDDIENATSLPKEAGEYQANENTLIIQLAKTTIVYRKNKETLTRQNIESPHTIRWNIPKAIIDCQLRPNNPTGQDYAVEIKTTMNYERAGVKIKKLKKAYIYFLPSQKTMDEK